MNSVLHLGHVYNEYVDYTSAEQYIYGLIGGHSRNRSSLEQARRLLKRLGNPEKEISSIHVVGTSGKGSTAHFLSSILVESGYQTGLFTSPHVIDIRERVQVNGQTISRSDFARLVGEIKPVIQQMQREGDGPTYFTVLLALSLLYFRLKGVVLGVLEAGVGGKEAATNALNPDLVVLTNVGMDHYWRLGHSLAEITAAKVGAIKPGVQSAVVGVNQSNLRALVQAYARKTQVPVVWMGQDFRSRPIEVSGQGNVFSFISLLGEIPNLQTKVKGRFQIDNATMAVASALQLKHLGFDQVNEFSIRRGLARVFIPGRFEVVQDCPTIILDGAHSPVKIESLIGSIKHIYPQAQFNVIFASAKWRDVKQSLAILGEVAKRFYFTQFVPASREISRRSIRVDRYPRLLREANVRVSYVLDPDPYRAFVRARSSEENLIITGSLLLISQLRGEILGRQEELVNDGQL